MHELPLVDIPHPKQYNNAFKRLKTPFFNYLMALMLILPLVEAIWMI